MPAATGTYRAWGPYARDILKGSIAVEQASRFKAILTTSAFTPNFDNDQRLSDVTGETFEGDWPTGGLVLTNVAVSLITASDELALIHDAITADEVTLPAAAARLIIYDDTGATSADKRLAFSAAISPTLLPVAGPIHISSPNGIVRSGY